MNPDQPPLGFLAPRIARRRRERRGFQVPPGIPAEQRRAIALRIHERIRTIKATFRNLSPEQKRAIFLKLTHDRPVTKGDLAGTGLTIVSQTDTETLVVPREPADLSKLEARIDQFGAGDQTSRPPGTELATHISDIQVANPLDRLSEQMLGKYQALVEMDFIKYEIEVASFKIHPSAARAEVQAIISEIREELGNGVHGRIYEHEVYGSGARILLSSSGAKLKDLVEQARWSRKIIIFDERPKFETFHSILSDFNIGNVTLVPPAADCETVCIIDTGVAAGNPFLAPVLRADISRSFIAGFSPTADAQAHGSGVASLAAYHTLDLGNGAANSANAFVVSARITADDGQLDHPQTENIDEDRARESRLLSTMLREIVACYAPQGIKIFVLAFQIVGHIWSQANFRLVPRNAWLARTIDHLSREYDVVFSTITGNINFEDVRDLRRENPYPGYLGAPLAKIHDPGHAVLAVTSGSLAHTANVITSPHAAIALAHQPSPFSRTGPGFGDAIKPDFAEYGGNLVYDAEFDRVVQNLGTNITMASGQITPAVQNSHGTSFAAPRTAHHLALISRDLRRVGVMPTAPLLRAFMASSATIPTAAQVLSPSEIRTTLGYGLPDGAAATDCSNHSVVFYWQGQMSVDHNAIFRFHVPRELAGVGRGRKRIVVAIASAPPVQAWGVAEYLGSEMKFRLFRGDQSIDEIEAALQRAEDEENIAAAEATEDLPCVPGLKARSVGALQRATYDWHDHDPAFSAGDYVLAVSFSKASWAKNDVTVPIGVVVRVEDTTGRYQELYARARASVQVRARV